jgi:hypothetical protein
MVGGAISPAAMTSFTDAKIAPAPVSLERYRRSTMSEFVRECEEWKSVLNNRPEGDRPVTYAGDFRIVWEHGRPVFWRLLGVNDGFGGRLGTV